MESKVCYFLAAALVSLVASLVAFQGVPSQYQIIVCALGAIAQGVIAWKAFVTPPPTREL